MKVIAIIEVPEGGKGKWYIDGEIRYTENESLMKKFDKEMVPLKPLPAEINQDEIESDREYYMAVGFNACLEKIGATE